MRLRVFLALLFLATLLVAPLLAETAACAATPEAAALLAFGGSSTGKSAGAGFRVQDVQVEATTRRVWVRVRRCDSDVAPAFLVPVQASLGSNVVSPLPQVAEVIVPATHAVSAAAHVALAKLFAVHVGEPVRLVFASASVHMELEGKALGQAAIGERVEVELRRNGDEPAHRIFGTVRAQDMVEVQP